MIRLHSFCLFALQRPLILNHQNTFYISQYPILHIIPSNLDDIWCTIWIESAFNKLYLITFFQTLKHVKTQGQMGLGIIGGLMNLIAGSKCIWSENTSELEVSSSVSIIHVFDFPESRSFSCKVQGQDENSWEVHVQFICFFLLFTKE